MRLKQIGVYLMIGVWALILSACNQVASVVIEQLQPTPVHTVVPVATPLPAELVATPIPTPVGGRRIPLLFISDRNGAGTTDLYQINPDGSGLIRLTRDGAIKRYPRWSPDGRRVAFASEAGGRSQIYLLSMSDYQVTQLTDLPVGATDPTWSPDGTQIAAVQSGDATNQILIIDSGTGAVVERRTVELSDLRSLAWAPLGQAIVFSAVADTREGDRDVYRLDLQTGLLANLTNELGDDDMPAWSPDGSRLLFQSDRDGNQDIFVMQADGSLQTALTRDEGVDVEPDWSADGTLVAFSSDRDGPYHLFVMSDSGADARALAPSAANDRAPAWPPRERLVIDQLAYAGGQPGQMTSNLFLVSMSGGQESSVTQTNALDVTPEWSPNGDRLVFSSDRTGKQELFILSADGGRTVRQLTDGIETALHPAWSPDGMQIAFEAQGENGDWDVWVINSDGSDLRNLTSNSSTDDGNPDWSPDGSQLVFSSNREGSFNLYILPMDDTGEVKRLTALDGNEAHPSWSPDGQLIAFRGDSEEGNHQIYVVQASGENVRPIFTSGFNDDTPVWSPGGQYIAFVSNRISSESQVRDRRYAVYTYNLRTARLERITQGGRDARYPAWRPRSATNVGADRASN